MANLLGLPDCGGHAYIIQHTRLIQWRVFFKSLLYV